jgi:hypothetical protein
MTQDPAFNDQVVCRWNELRQNVLSNQRIGTWIDSTAQVLNESQDWNFTVWPIIGNYVWPNYYIGQSYQEEVDTLKWWIDKRGIFLQNSLMGNPANCSPVNLSQNNDLEELNLFPNPFTNQLQAQIYCKEDDMIEIKLTDLLGNLLLYKKVLSQLGINQIEIYNGSELSAGVYQLQFTTKHKQWNRKVIAKGNE